MVSAAVRSRPDGAQRLEIGTHHGDESERFIQMCKVLVRVGGGPQSHREVRMFRELHANGLVMEVEIPLKSDAGPLQARAAHSKR